MSDPDHRKGYIKLILIDPADPDGSLEWDISTAGITSKKVRSPSQKRRVRLQTKGNKDKWQGLASEADLLTQWEQNMRLASGLTGFEHMLDDTTDYQSYYDELKKKKKK